MKHSTCSGSVCGKIATAESGQAAMEFALLVTLMLVLFFMVIDFGRAIHDVQVIAGLSRQGSNLASRGTSLSASATAVLEGDSSLNLSNNGEVIITSVSNINKVYTITGQVAQGKITQTSRVGNGVGNTATVPSSAAALLAPNQTIYITEVFYSYQPITPLKNLLKLALPATLYQAAYF